MNQNQHNETTADFFSGWADTGKGHSMAKGHSALVEGIYATIPPAGKSVVDIGCGIGGALSTAVENGAHSVAGIDLSENMIKVGRERLPQADLHIGAADQLPWTDNSFDLAISVEAMYYFQDPVAGLKEICRVVKPGGVFASAIEFYGENAGSMVWAEQLPMKIWCWSSQEWTDAFEQAGFTQVATSRIVRKDYKSKEEFQPSDFFPDYTSYLDYIQQGALLITGQKS